MISVSEWASVGVLTTSSQLGSFSTSCTTVADSVSEWAFVGALTISSQLGFGVPEICIIRL